MRREVPVWLCDNEGIFSKEFLPISTHHILVFNLPSRYVLFD